MKQVQDVIERLWDFIDKLDINTFGENSGQWATIALKKEKDASRSFSNGLRFTVKLPLSSLFCREVPSGQHCGLSGGVLPRLLDSPQHPGALRGKD